MFIEMMPDQNKNKLPRCISRSEATYFDVINNLF